MRKQEQKGKITALYERLSHDDGRSDESVSVENQENICQGGFHQKVKSPLINWSLSINIRFLRDCLPPQKC